MPRESDHHVPLRSLGRLGEPDARMVRRLAEASERGVDALIAAYPAIRKARAPGLVRLVEPCRGQFSLALGNRRYGDAKRLLWAFIEHFLPLLPHDEPARDSLYAEALSLAAETSDSQVYYWTRTHLEPPQKSFQSYLKNACYHAARGDRGALLSALDELYRAFPHADGAELLREPALASRSVDSVVASAIHRRVEAPQEEAPHPSIVWRTPPDDAEVRMAIKEVVGAITHRDLDGLGSMVTHARGLDALLGAIYAAFIVIRPSRFPRRWEQDFSWMSCISLDACVRVAGDGGDGPCVGSEYLAFLRLSGRRYGVMTKFSIVAASTAYRLRLSDEVVRLAAGLGATGSSKGRPVRPMSTARVLVGG